MVNQVNSNALGNAGEIKIDTVNFSIVNGAQIAASNFGTGNGGTVNINADTISFNGVGENGFNSGIFSSVEQAAIGNAGNINITTNELFLNNGAQITAATFGQGSAGFVNINANTISLNEEIEGVNSGIFSSVEQDGVGNAGGIQIFTTELSLANGARISTGTSGEGNGGNIFVQTDSLTLTDGGRIASNIEIAGQGNAGTLEIIATDSIVINGSATEGFPSAITSVVNGGLGNGEGIGNAGAVTITTSFLSLIDGGRVSATALGQGNGGDLTINATESIFISGFTERFRSGISVDALINDGNSGDASITTNKLTIENGGTIEASNFDSLEVFDPGTGEPGNISITANSIDLNNGGRIDAATQSETGEGANINLQIADNITLRNDSFISAQAFGNADGGNLIIDTNFIIAFPNQIAGDGNDIIASAVDGDGGNINITAESLLGIQERMAIEDNQTNDIDASSDFGLGGSVSIFTPDINPVQGITELPNNVVEPEQTTAQTCEANRETVAKNGFTIKGRGGIPSLPTSPLNSENISVNNETNPTSVVPAPIETSQGKIQPARGIKVTESGEVILTAYRTNNAGERIPEIKRNCE